MSNAGTILFVNQTPNRMLNDIARVYRDNGWTTELFCGSLPPSQDGFSAIHRSTTYNRQGFFNRIQSWSRFNRELKLFAGINQNRFQRVFLVSNPPFTLYQGKLFKQNNRNCTVELLVYDLYPEVIYTTIGSWSKLFFLPMEWMNRKHFKNADIVFTPSETLSDYVKGYYEGKIESIYNWTDTNEFTVIPKSENRYLQKKGLRDTFTILYSGNLGKTHDIKTIQDAVEKLPEEGFRFCFIGHGSGMEELKSKVASNPRFIFDELQSEEMFPHSIASGDVALVSYKKGAEGYSIPSKLPYYFATGTPVIMIGNPDSELGQILLKNKLGWCIPNGKHEDLVQLLLSITPELRSQYSKRVIQFVRQEWSVDNASQFYHA